MARPLGCDSCHLSKIHFTWPQMVLREALRTCRWGSDREAVKQLMIDRFQAFHAPQRLLDALKATTHIQFAKVRKQQHATVWWCVVPYHPCWQKQGVETVKRFNECVASRAIFRSVSNQAPPLIKISWRHGIAPITTLIQSA